MCKSFNQKIFAAAYIRVSTESQTELSPASQLKIIKKFAEEKGYVICENYIFRDNGISGRYAEKRPEFNRMISFAKQKPSPFSVVLVWKFSRFARNQEESIFYKSLLRKNKIDVISVSEPIDDGPFGKLIERIIEWSDEYYSIRLSGEVRRGMTEKAENGGVVSIAPFGYKIKSGELTIDEQTADTVKNIFFAFSKNHDTAAICRQLNNKKIRTNNGNSWDKRSIEYILQNPIYTGKIRWNPVEKTGRNFGNKNLIISGGKHTPIIDSELFGNVQKIISKYKNSHNRYTHTKIKTPYLLHGLISCSDCGASLIAVKDKTMQCCGYIHGKCKVSHSVSIVNLDNLVTEMFNILLSNNFINYTGNLCLDSDVKTGNKILACCTKKIIFDRRQSHVDIFLKK